jgi:hypothetical protein
MGLTRISGNFSSKGIPSAVIPSVAGNLAIAACLICLPQTELTAVPLTSPANAL